MNLLGVVGRFAEEQAEFDPNQVTPGWEGFVFTGLIAVAIIVLGFNLVSRLRRNAYRAEVQEEIARELSEGDATGAAGEPGPDPEPRT